MSKMDRRDLALNIVSAGILNSREIKLCAGWRAAPTRSSTRAEISIDMVFKSDAEREDAKEFFHHHFVRRWHSQEQAIKVYRAEEVGSSGVV